jgi:hypothetical protein
MIVEIVGLDRRAVACDLLARQRAEVPEVGPQNLVVAENVLSDRLIADDDVKAVFGLLERNGGRQRLASGRLL